MAKENILASLRNYIASLESENARKAIKEALDNNIPPVEIITNGISKGAEVVGDRFERSEYFLSELMMGGEILKEALQILKPYIDREDIRSKGKVVIGTVEGDVHDIGKNIVVMFLESYGFEVVDLGVDVPKDNFVNAVKEHKAHILAMSALMTHTAPVMGEVIEYLKATGHREKVNVIIGGMPTTPEFGKRIGADYQTNKPSMGVKKCLEWVKGKEGVR